jgi:transglutaminase-like putative cysteine protease
MIHIRKHLFGLFIGSAMSLQAGPVEDQLRQAGSADDYPGANLLVVFDSIYSDMQENGLTYVHTHKLYKVFTTTGALQLSVIKYDYDPLSAYVDIEKIIVHRAAGTTDTLDMGAVLDYPAPARAIYWGAREKMIEVGRLEPGDGLEVFLFRKGFTYALLQAEGDDDKYIPPMKGHFYDIVPFYSDDPVREKVYQASIPLTKQLQYEVYNGQLASSAVIREGKMVYTFTGRDIRPVKREPGMVDLSDVATKVLLSTSPDWYAKSMWFYQVNEDFGSFDSTPEIDRKVAEILRGARTEMDSVSRLTHWVADEIRYSGISMGCGEGYTLHKGEMTFLDRCGVCKDKAGMLVTMLRAAGFESYAAMTMAGSRIDYIPADQFNHSVTVVKLSDGKYHLLDPTWVPFVRELWSSAEQQQNYLMGLPEGADLAVTPVSSPLDHFIKIYGNSELSVDGTLTGEVIVKAEGQSDAAVRRLFTGGYKDHWKLALETELKRIHPGAVLTDVDYGDPYDYMTAPIKIKINYVIPRYAMVTGAEIIVRSFIASGFMKRALGHLYIDTAPATRTFPFRDRCSRLVQLNESMKLPGNYRFMYQPAGDKFGDATASFEGYYDLSLTGETLRMVQIIALEKRIYQAEEWPSFRKAVLAQNRFIEEPVILMPQ